LSVSTQGFRTELKQIHLPWIFDRKEMNHLVIHGSSLEQDAIAKGVKCHIP